MNNQDLTSTAEMINGCIDEFTMIDVEANHIAASELLLQIKNIKLLTNMLQVLFYLSGTIVVLDTLWMACRNKI